MRGALHLRLGWAALLAASLAASARAAEGPQTRPAAETARVLVLPFESISSDANGDPGQSRALARGLALDLAAAPSISCAEGDEVAPDAGAAVAAGKAADVRFVVWGTVQRASGRVRVAGQLLDVGSGDAVGHFKVTGAADDWFELQDAVAEQVKLRVAKATASPERADDPRGTHAITAVEPVEVPAGEPLRLRRHARSEGAPDWVRPAAGRDRFGEVARRQDGRQPRWGWGHGYWSYGGYDGCHRPYRSLRFRFGRYTYGGVPGRSFHRHYGPRGIGRFVGPVPLRWMYR